MSAASLSTALDAAWEQQQTKATRFNQQMSNGQVQPELWRVLWWTTQSVIYSRSSASLEEQWKRASTSTSPDLARALNDVLGASFWIGGLCKILADICQMMGPIVIKHIINFTRARSKAKSLGEAEPPLAKGIFLAVFLFLLSMTTSLSHHQFFWRSIVSGMLARTALISSMYKRSIGLTAKSKSKLSNATIINYISTDVSRVEACAQWFHPVWASPIQVTICMAILLFHLGPAALVGVALFFVIVPLQKRILRRQFRIRKRLSKITELRTKSLLEALVLAATLAFLAYSRSGQFELPVIFASLSLFQLLRQPMIFWPRAMSLTSDASSSLRRVSSIYAAETIQDSALDVDPSQSAAILVENATFQWEAASSQRVKQDKGNDANNSAGIEPTGEPSPPFTLQNISISVPRGSLVAVVGSFASGKSGLLQGLVGEMHRLSGKVSFSSKFAYCPQTPWLRKGTLRDNIVFGRPFDEKRYQQVLKDVCLVSDIRALANGDLTETGENGMSFSGGQRQRIGLARALYCDSDILILDDPLSGADSRVGNEIFQNAILGAIKSGKTIIMVTYFWNLLPHCNYIYYLREGRIAEQGTFEELRRLNKSFDALHAELDASRARTSRKVARKGTVKPLRKGPAEPSIHPASEQKCVKAYKIYLSAARGALSAPTLLVAILVMQGSQVLSSRNLVWWQSNSFNRSLGFYQSLYATFGLLQAFFALVLGLVVDSISCLVSRNLHNVALQNVLHAPMSFFERTPRGRILTHFGKDLDSIDNQLPVCLSIGTVLGSITVITLVQPSLLLVVLVVFAGYQHFAKIYRKASKEVERIESSLRSNVYAHFAESLGGLQTLRSYDQVDPSVSRLYSLLDLQNRASFVSATTQRWLSLRLDFCGAILVFAVALCAVLGVGSIGAAQIGLVLTYTTTLTQMGGLLTRQITDAEKQMNAVERIGHYHDKQTFSSGSTAVEEAPEVTQPSHNWPEKGAISLRNVCVSYRPGNPKVLSNIGLDIQPGEKLGIVGRTGAGKSSLVNCLMRIVPYSGLITIDGVDISTIGLQSLRSKLSFVPQQPVVFGGTIRTALDPHGQYEDETLLAALRRGFAQIENKSPDYKVETVGIKNRCFNLEATIEPEGSNLSVGEKALLSLTRVLVRNSRIVILDEAT
ncbi:hypothetical protein EST38_g7714 [Candolleomyces aberdarensis]|uniref:Uncharacterized protein n=1 Tax=Candolleomyces aberdarensis TaxID=2316362 RepID=A0A4Q2DEF5_9AGAR|nr:hypothetical protein EST38_g7714 [Candolleomyces aberdarensis]